jgi:protoheme IX farnesyltransferase
MEYVKAGQPRVVALFLVSVLAAMLLARRGGPLLIVVVLAAVGLTVAGAAMLNNTIERDIDARMARTRDRPIAAGRLQPRRALLAGLAAVAGGVTVLAFGAGLLPAALALAGAVYYVAIYTILIKPRTALSAVPGGLAGIFPPLVGWAATGAPWTARIVFLCALVFVWSPPHFWALSFALRPEYVASGVPTPVVRYGESVTCLQILACVTTLTALTMLPAVAGLYGPVYLGAALAAGLGLLFLALRLTVQRSAGSAWALFKCSGPYLALLLAAMPLDRLH